MKTIEVVPNVFITNTIAGSFVDPMSVLDELGSLPSRVVGGLHNLSAHDKFLWASNENGPLRIVERGTEREEIWFPRGTGKDPSFITLDSRTGMIQSHKRFNNHLQAVEFNNGSRPFKNKTIVKVWYNEGAIHSFEGWTGNYMGNCGGAAITSKLFIIKPKDTNTADYIKTITFHWYCEVWDNGKWVETTVDRIGIVFKNTDLNNEKTQKRALEWIKKHCKQGFFPLSENLFGDEEEEFMFIADICGS